jgi:hypothetical protein
MSDKKMEIAGQIEGRCTKCRRNTNHTIIAIVDEVPVKVQCNTCKREHKYRAPTVPKTIKAGTTTKTAAYKSAERKKWELNCKDGDISSAKNYSMTGAYKVDMLINHPTFGIGLVQRVTVAQKVEVLFESGTKLLRCK